eukprot:TRINITY_DN30971_c0_g1_i1.p1 TRINITY_DN30971_c0_g1~~TRINITY_DN30971_c0_g1_i1.p1  ORF type:complete len:696 (+),score=123.32 TRINITY_DN30971_c0_g1_i1:37-2124(+)
MSAIAHILSQPVTADAKMKGPTKTSNYILPGKVLMGDDPTGGAHRLEQLKEAGMEVFVDLRDMTSASNYLKSAGVGGEYVSFPFHCEDYGARKAQKDFVYSLLDRIHAGESIYIHDHNGHEQCGVVAALLLASLYRYSGMKALNIVAQLHEVRDNTYGADCPISRDLKAYVKEVARDLDYKPGVGLASAPAPAPAPSLNSVAAPSEASTGDHTSTARFAHSRGKHGGGSSSINLFGGSSVSAPSTPDVMSRSLGRSCGGGATQVNLFDTTPVKNAAQSDSIIQPVQQEVIEQPRTTPIQQNIPRLPSTPQQSPMGFTTVTLTRPNPSHPWGFALDGLEFVSVAADSPAADAGVPLGVLIGIDDVKIESEEELHLLGGGRTEVTLHVAQRSDTSMPSQSPGALATYHLVREPGQSWGIDVEELWVVGVFPGSVADQAGVRKGRMLYLNNVELTCMADLATLAEATEVTIKLLPNEFTSAPVSPNINGSQARQAESPAEAMEVDQEVPQQDIELPPPFNTRDKNELKDVVGPTRTTNWVVRGRLLCGGSPDNRRLSDLQALANTGITTVINLRADKNAGYMPALEKAAGRKINLVTYHLSDGQVPKETKTFMELINRINAMLKAGEIIYIHCKGGHGETGMVVACVLATLYDLPHMKALNVTGTLHSQRHDTEDQCSPQTQEQRIFVLEILKTITSS